MRNKNFLNEINALTEETVTIRIKSDDKTLMRELLAESQDCVVTGKPPHKLIEMIQKSETHGPPPKVDENGGTTRTYFPPARLNLGGYPEVTIDSLERFIAQFESFVPEATDVISDGFTEDQKYLLRLQQGAFRWAALGLFHKIFGSIPDVLNDESCPLKKGSFKDEINLVVEAFFALFKLIEAGEKYIREYAKKCEKDYTFDSPLQLLIEIIKTDGENIFTETIAGTEDRTTPKELKKQHAIVKKYTRSVLERESLQTSGDPRYMDWRVLIFLALAPHYKKFKHL
jgi:hypothetical protein